VLFRSNKGPTSDDILQDLRAQVAEINIQTLAIGRNEGAQARLNAELEVARQLSEDNLRLTPEQTVQMEKYFDQIEEGANQLKLAQEQMEFFRDVGQSVASTLDQAFETFAESGKINVREMVASMLKDIAKLTFQKGVSGPLSQLLSTGLNSAFGGFGGGSFGGARAAGGPVQSGKSFLVGEEGPELFDPPGPGNIVPNNQLSNNSKPAGMTFNQNFSTGITPPDRAWIESMIQRGMSQAVRIAGRNNAQAIRQRGDSFHGVV